jgi:hypothetical protein
LNTVEDGRKILVDVGVGDAKHMEVATGEDEGALGVVPRRFCVGGAVEFDDQAGGRAVEVDDEAFDDLLPPEAVTADLLPAKRVPQHLFRGRWGAPQLARTSDVLPAHTLAKDHPTLKRCSPSCRTDRRYVPFKLRLWHRSSRIKLPSFPVSGKEGSGVIGVDLSASRHRSGRSRSSGR